jgi:hypothetical protein
MILALLACTSAPIPEVVPSTATPAVSVIVAARAEGEIEPCG